jgi:DNA-binding LacI/PurR family transcriptional regulator
MAAVMDLTTVAQNAEKQGTTAAQSLIHVLESGTDAGTDEPVILPSNLILRGSTAPLRTVLPRG